jgi:hypothetical protein
MTVNSEPFETLDPVAFAAALVAAPLLVALICFWALLIPVFAVLFGGPVYLAFGTPVLLWMVTRVRPYFVSYACVGVLVQSGLTLLLALSDALHPHQGTGDLLPAALFGMIFAPLWAGTFAALYRRWYRPARLFPVM